MQHSLLHFYTRLLVLKCYEDYHLRHDAEPINLMRSDRVAIENHPHIEAIQRRQLELVKLKQDLLGYPGTFAHKKQGLAIHEASHSTESPPGQQFQGLLADIEALLSLYEYSMKMYKWRIRWDTSDYTKELAWEQLEEVKISKATSISLGKLSNMAFLYLPINFVCAMLGMNLSILGQGTVPIWVFLSLTIFFSLVTYLPILLPQMSEQKVRLYKVGYHLTKRSFSAGFWFLAFCLTHTYRQNFEIMDSGLTQILLGSTRTRRKGWKEGNDNFFREAAWGSLAFWKEKVHKIYRAVEELNFNNEPTHLNV